MSKNTENSKKIKAVLFDLDGVLVNTEPMHFRMWQTVFKRYGLDVSYDVYKGCIGSTQQRLFELIKEAYDVDFSTNPKIKQEATDVKIDLIEREGYPKIDGVPEMIRTLRESGYTLAIASSSPPAFIQMAMDHLGIGDAFTLMNSAEHVAHPKPAPDVYLNTMEKLRLTPEECIVVEDSTNGSHAAKAAGMLCIGFENPDSGDQDLSCTDYKIHAMSELTPELIQQLEGRTEEA